MDLDGLIRAACQYEGALTLAVLAVLLMHHLEIKELRRQVNTLWERHLDRKEKP